MSEQEQKKSEEQVSGQKPEPAKEQADVDKLSRSVSSVEAERLSALKKELLETETRIDKKINDFKKFVDNTEISGRSLAGSAVSETNEEKARKDANKLLEGTGFEF
jgi:hypothetical protein